MADEPISLRAAIEQWLAYRPSPDRLRVVLNPYEYDVIASAVERGQASEWLTSAFRAGRFVRAEVS